MLDQDGFQQVRYRKNARRNIFENADGGGRKDILEHEQEIHTDPVQCGQKPVGKPTIEENEGNQQDQGGDFRDSRGEEPSQRYQPCLEEGGREGSSGGQEAASKETGSRPAEVTTAGEPHRTTDPEEDSRMQEAGAGPSDGSSPKAIQVTTEIEGGRGDPASTMLWSPIKRAGQKRPLEEHSERDELENEADAGEEDREEESEHGLEIEMSDGGSAESNPGIKSWEEEGRPTRKDRRGAAHRNRDGGRRMREEQIEGPEVGGGGDDQQGAGADPSWQLRGSEQANTREGAGRLGGGELMHRAEEGEQRREEVSPRLRDSHENQWEPGGGLSQQ